MSSSAASSGKTVLVSARALAVSRESPAKSPFEGERAGPGAPQHGDVADRSERTSDVAGEGADIGAFGDGERRG